VIDIGLVFLQRRVIAWPASALLTGNGTAFILRAQGTRHGDWWSLHGAYLFVAACVVGVLSKYLIRYRSRPIFNSSNLALVACFLIVGTKIANPLDFFWGPPSPAIVAALAVIVVGGLLITSNLRMLGVSLGFWAVFASSMGVVSARGHCITARWHVGPVCGSSLWTVLVTSPEILVFMFFMITDPRTTPTSGRARIAWGASIGFVSALLAAPQRTEFATKVAVLGGLLALCAARPLIEMAIARTRRSAKANAAASASRPARSVATAVRQAGLASLTVAVGAAVLIAAGTPARTSTFDLVSVSAVDAGIRDSLGTTIPTSVGLDPAVTRLDASIGKGSARQIALDVAQDLTILDRAVTTANSSLAPAAAHGAWLTSSRAQIAAAKVHRVAPTTYRFTNMRVVVIRDPTNPQAAAQIGVAVRGTTTQRGVTTSLRATYVVVFDGAHYLIADQGH
jgi:hypothetical protein